MLRHPVYTRTRIAQVGERIAAHIYPEWCDPDSLMVSGPVDRISLEEAEQLAYRDAKLGEQFGPLWTTFWFRIGATVPPEWAGHRVDLLWVTHSEATLWIGGRSIQGLNTSHEGPRPDALLLEQAAGGEQLELRIELACNGKFGSLDRPYATVEPVVLDRCHIARFDPQAWQLHHDFDVLRRLEADAPNGLDPTWAGELLSELNRFCNVWAEHDRSTWEEASDILQRLLLRRNASVVHELSAIGHAHIDTAWLWPLEETHRKLVRSFSSQTAYMARYPEFRFCCSQAYQYDWVRRAQPRPVRPHPASSRCRAVGAGGRHLGGARLQPALGRVAGAPVPVRPAVLRARVRPPPPRVLESRRVRLQRPAAPDHARRRHRPVPHPEALLEPVQRSRTPHLHLAGHRRV